MEAITSVVDWAKQRERRLEEEARLDAEIKIQRMRAKAHAKELKTNLTAFMKKLEANQNYIEEQLKDREQARKGSLEMIKEFLQLAHKCIDQLKSKDSTGIPSTQKDAAINAIVMAIGAATRAIDKFPSGPLATLD